MPLESRCGCTASHVAAPYYVEGRPNRANEVSIDAFTETFSVPRRCDHRTCGDTVCYAVCGAGCSPPGLSGASSRPSRAACPWRADLPEQLQLLPWLGCQRRRNPPEPGP